METSRSVVSVKLRLQAIDALRRARRLPIGPHRNDLRQLAIGLRSLELRERQSSLSGSVMVLAALQGDGDALPGHSTAEMHAAAV